MALYSLTNKKIWIPGSQGMVSSAIIRRLRHEKCDILATDRKDVDLLDKASVDSFLANNRPEAIFLAAAKVGGIHANSTMPANFIYQNMMIQNHVIHASYEFNVEKLLFLGSSCIYPREAAMPIQEESLLTGPLEPTNQWYAIAKISGIKMCQAYRKQYNCNFITAMPTNLYGPFDNFHEHNSHVPAALLSRFHRAKMDRKSSIDVWGTGQPKREFMHVDDLADACIFLMKNYDESEIINIGTGQEISIGEFAQLIKKAVQFAGDIVYDHSKPDGMMRKIMDDSKMQQLGWQPSIKLENGLRLYYQWFLDHQEILKGA